MGESPAARQGCDATLAPEAEAEVPTAQRIPLASTLALLLAACGGGDASTPEGLRDVSSAPYRPDLLPHDKREHLQPYHLAALGTRKQGQASRTPTTDEFLDWAENTFPAFFPSKEPSQFANGMVLRSYPGSGITLAVQQSTGDVLGLGPFSNNQAVKLGRLADFADAVLAPTPASQPLTDEDAARFLLHAQFSASTEDIAAVRTKGYAGWLDEELTKPNSLSAWDWLVAKGYDAVDERELFLPNPWFRYANWFQLMRAPDATRRRLALALSELFVVSHRGIKDVIGVWDGFAMSAYWDILCKHALGNYRDLIEDLTLNPAMGVFLNTHGNQKEDPATGRLPDENYARELMQLFSIGLYELNLDGTPKLDSLGRPIETYSQDDVRNLARVFTGYRLDTSVGSNTNPKPPHQTIWNIPYARNNMRFDAVRHSTLEKRFLGTVIAAGTSGPESLRLALDTIFNHGNVGPFLARQFIQRLVASYPSAGYVARVASVFNNNGAGVRGDLRATLRAVLLDPEARGAASLADPMFGKLREPVVRLAQWGRTFNAQSKFNTWKFDPPWWVPTQDIGQYPMDPPSVFGFFRPGYVPPGTSFAVRRATVPEFQIVTESTVSSWANFIMGLIANGHYVKGPELLINTQSTANDGFDIVPNYSEEIKLFGKPQALVQRLNLLLCAGQLSQPTQEAIVNALLTDRTDDTWTTERRRMHVCRAIFMVMCCGEYMAQR